MKNDSAKVIFRESKQFIDHSTGEVSQEEITQKIRVQREPNFIKLYLADILYLSDLPAGLSGVLFSFLRRMTYDGEIYVNRSMKETVANEVNLTANTVNKAITLLVKGKILIRADRGKYYFNPHLFGKGDWSQISSLRATIEWNSQGRTVMEVVKQENENE